MPLAHESLPSMLWRLQREVGIYPQHASGLKTYRSLYDDPDPAALRRTAEALGLPAQVLGQHTLAGRLGETYNQLSWWDFRQPGRWACPACGHQTVWTRLVLVSACTACGILLSSKEESPTRPAPETARRVQRHYLNALVHGRLADDDRIARWWRLLSFHLCTGWPVHPESGLEPMPRGSGLGTNRELGWRNPDWIAEFAVTGWPAVETVRSFRGHIKTVATQMLAPDLAEAEPDVDVVESRKRLHRRIRAWGLAEHHIPDHVLPDGTPFDGCHAEAIGYAISRALRREVVHATTRHRPTKDELLAGRRPLRQTRELAGINQLLACDAAGVEILTRLAARLAQPGRGERIDYRHRRETLATLRTVPSSILKQLSPALRERKVPARVRANPLGRDAAAWIWIQLAGGVLHHSPHHAAARTRLRSFDRTLTPEDRLLLLEYGYEVLGAVADDVTRQHRPAAVGVEREDQADAS
ncbi:hypothetical protein K8W59_19665 [Nocardioides rotundus]|uniref:hypothetical protein n=1 Tax=Nocardioides rotundus TaxID=1774216 RepID=UPI001CBDC351|nr:hypothetical protein [Nocardioides rotundus]UAL29909.1 hypothetical protein K8W59_19665 [Nocardioides rotundus]